MSQTVTGNDLTAKDVLKLHRQAYEERIRSGLRCGPSYSFPESSPLVWYDQVFEREFTPAGSVTCEQALRVGSTQNGLDVVLIGSHSNAGNVTAAKDATITATLYQADEMDGTFTEVGPTICFKAPAEGISAEPCHTFARFPLGNFTKAWLKVKLDFTGTISGGKVDCVLGYVPR